MRSSLSSDIATEIMATYSNVEHSYVVDLFSREVGYATPKVDVRAAIFRNDTILLVKERADGLWTSLPILNIQRIWFPIIENWLTPNFSENQRIYLVIDRTKWQRKNLMMISLIDDKRAIPIYWEFLPRMGNSNFEEQSKIFSQVLGLFNRYQRNHPQQ